MNKIISGIYCFENLINHKKYIGYTNNISRRHKEHLYRLRKGIQNNRHFQNAWNKYGEENFIFCVLEECENNIITLKSRETYYIQKYRAIDECYNLTDGGNGYGGYISDDTRLLMSKLTKGENNPRYGVPVSQETRDKMSKAWEGRVISEETKAKQTIKKIGSTNRRGKKQKNRPTSSKYIGVYWHKRNKWWECALKFHGKKIYLGGFKDENDAARAYNEGALKYFGEDAILNIIIE